MGDSGAQSMAVAVLVPHFRYSRGARSGRLSRTLVFYAVVSDEIERMIEFFWSRDEAEEMLAPVLRDEPDWRDVTSRPGDRVHSRRDRVHSRR